MRVLRLTLAVSLTLSLVALGIGACSSSSSSSSATDGGGNDATHGSDSPAGDTGSSGDSGNGRDTGPGGDCGVVTCGTLGDAGGDGGMVTLDFDPNGNGSPDAIYWDDAKQILYIVDDENNQVWTYTDANGFQKYVTVPDNPTLDDAGHTKLNGVTELADGTLVITRFGYGVGGAIYTVSPDGGTATVPNVPANRKRIEVSVDPASATLYSDSFTGGGGSTPAGEIETVSLTNGATAYASGFGKTVGLLVQGSSILVADQTNNVILAVPTDPSQLAAGGATLADGAAFPVYANVISPDQLCAGPNGTIYTDEFQAPPDGGGIQVRQISPDGGVVVPFPTATFTSLDDVAYDATNHRLFVVDNNGTTVRTIKIFPVSQ